MSEDLGMENQKFFVVSQPAEIWFMARVEAGSEEEALAKAGHPSFPAKEWQVDWDSLAFVDGDWDVYSDEEDDK